MKRNKGVFIEGNRVSIFDEQGEIVSWQEDEWLKEPETLTVIRMAIRVFYTQGPEYLRELLIKDQKEVEVA